MNEKDLMKILEGKERALYLIEDTGSDANIIVSLTKEQVNAIKYFLEWAEEDVYYIRELNKNIHEW